MPRRARRGGRSRPAAAVLVAVCIPFTTTQIPRPRRERSSRGLARRSRPSTRSTGSIAAVGGRHGDLPCKTSFIAINHSVQTAMAWKLHVTLERVGTSMRAPGIDFIGPHNSIDGGPARVDPRLTQHETWRSSAAGGRAADDPGTADTALRRSLTR